jgi:prephenate dehydratase
MPAFDDSDLEVMKQPLDFYGANIYNGLPVRAGEGGEVEEGVVPIENSIEGAVNETLDLLIHADKTLYIRSETVLPIEHLLLVKPGTRKEAVTAIKSFPVAIAQCRAFISRDYPDAEIEAALEECARIGLVQDPRLPFAGADAHCAKTQFADLQAGSSK